MRIRLVSAAPRRVLGGTLLPYLLMAALLPVGLASAQVAVPKYQGPLAAPAPRSTLPAPAPITPDGEVVEFPIVRVNDQIIDRSDYERGEQQLMEDAQRDNATPAELEQRKKDLLRDMIDQQLLISRGKELDINADSEIIRRLDDIRKQNHFDTMEDLEKAVRQSGVSYEDFKANIKNSIVTQQVVRDEVGRNLHLTAKMEQAYYEQHKQEFEQPESLRLSEILISTPDAPTDAQLAAAQVKADDVVAKLKAGAKFEDLVRQYPDSPNPDKGGDLNAVYVRGDGKLAKVLEDQVFPLKAGESTAPIRTRQGFVIFKVTEHTPAGIPPLSAVDNEVQNAMYQELMAPALRTYLTDLREKAYVDIAPGFIDTGASAKETKPVYASSTLPAPKKKAKKARLDQGRATTPAATPTPSAAALTSSATPAPAVPTTTAAKSAKPGKTETVAANKKPKKIPREKIRYGQAPQNSLPSAPEVTLATGADAGPGSSSMLPAPGAAIASIDQSITNSDIDPLAPKAPEGKTRFSDRAPVEAKQKAATKTLKIKQKAAAAPTPLTAQEKAAQQVENAPLGLSGDTATKKKTKSVKGTPKERIQEAPPAPPTPKPDATPIPPKSVRDNGEPAVTPPPSNLPPVTPPAATDAQPAPPASPTPTPQ